MEINDQEINLNIRYDMHEEDWKDLIVAFEQLPGWVGVQKNGEFYWIGKESDEMYIKGKVTFTGFLLEASLPDLVWNTWLLNFLEKTSEALGFEIKEV